MSKILFEKNDIKRALDIVKDLRAELIISNLKIEELEEINSEMLEALKNWNKSFGDSLRFQDYHVNVFDALNKRYIESKKIIEKATGLPIKEVML